MPSMRSVKAWMSTSGSACSRPMPRMRREKLMAPPVAIIVLDGMQSQRCAAPPMTSRSITVTLAPRRAAYVAARLPAGPPPMMRNRRVTPDRLRPVRVVMGHSRGHAVCGAGEQHTAPHHLCDGDGGTVGVRERGAGDHVRAVGGREVDLVPALTDPLEVHAVRAAEVAAPREAVLAEDAHDVAVHSWTTTGAVRDGVRVERHPVGVPRQETDLPAHPAEAGYEATAG